LPLTSDQLELLLALESSENLEKLAKAVQKDKSVVSRNLQRIQETIPVVAKHQGRWGITALGRTFTSLTRKYLEDLDKSISPATPVTTRLPSDAVLLVVNAQVALLDPGFGPRSNPDAEKNISVLLNKWRELQMSVAHVRHVMDEPGAPFYIESRGVNFIPLLSPKSGEIVLDKRKASAFSGTGLQEKFQERGSSTVVVIGFTANECVDATARQANDLGFTTFVVGDATAMFDVPGSEGVFHRAERVHNLVLSNLQAFFAKVLDTTDVLKLVERV